MTHFLLTILPLLLQYLLMISKILEILIKFEKFQEFSFKFQIYLLGNCKTLFYCMLKSVIYFTFIFNFISFSFLYLNKNSLVKLLLTTYYYFAVLQNSNFILFHANSLRASFVFFGFK